jgi:hypothetical protein
MDDNVYIHTLVVALSCLPTALSVGITINVVGKKLMLGKGLVFLHAFHQQYYIQHLKTRRETIRSLQ